MSSFDNYPVADDQPCKCGSGQHRWPLYDAAKIFLQYCCDACEDTVRRKFNPVIFDGRAPYASSGEEADIFIDYDTGDDD
jgi:hypothetical protein